MAEDNNQPPKQNPSDVLKKLKDVRRKLQESLSEGEEKQAVKTPQEKLDIIPGATETLARAAAEKERAKLEKEMAAAEKVAAPQPAVVAPGTPQRQLYKAGGEETAQVVAPKVAKAKGPQKPRVTARRLAAIQRRVRARTKQARTMGAGRRVALIICLGIAILPIIGSMQVSLLGCEFDYENFAIDRDQSAPRGEFLITIPVRNPGMLPAFMGQVSLKIFNATPDTKYFVQVLEAASVQGHVIAPYDTIKLSLQARLDPDKAGDWLKDLLSSKMLNLQIRDLSYNGLTVPNEIIPAIHFDVSGLLDDLLGGLLDIEGLIEGMFTARAQTTDKDIYRNLWAEAKLTQLQERVPSLPKEVTQNPTTAQFDDLLAGLGLEGLSIHEVGIAETDERMTINLTIGAILPALSGFNLGPIVISYLNASIWLNNQDPLKDAKGNLIPPDTDHKEKYKYELARLEIRPSKYVGDMNTEGMEKGTKWSNKDYEVFPGEKNDGAYIVLDGQTPSNISVSISIFKDKYTKTPNPLHPSAYLDWANQAQVDAFAAEAKTKYPTWYFLYWLLTNGSLDIFLNVARADIEVFGVIIKNMPLDILPPIYLDGVLKIENLLSPYGVGFGDALAMFLTSATTGGLALPAFLQTRYNYGKTELLGPRAAQLYGETMDDQLNEMLNLDNIEFDLGAIKETWGPDAALSLAVTLPVNNTIFDVHLGLRDAQIKLGSTLPTEPKDTDPTYFAILDLQGNGGSNQIYLNGSTPPWCVTNITAALTILKNETYAPYAAQFLRQFLETFTLEAWLNIHIGELVLFKENMTLKGIDLALELSMDLGDMVNDLISGLAGDLIGDLVGGLLGTEEPSNTTVQALRNALSNPLTAPIVLPMALTIGSPAVAAVLGKQPRTGQLDSLLGDLLGSEVTADFSVTATPMYTDIDLALGGLEINAAELGLPITIGIGYSNLAIMGNRTTEYGGTHWTNIVEMQINNYVDLGSKELQTIIAKLRLHEAAFSDHAMCNFLDEFLNTGQLNMRIEGITTLNLSGIFIDNLKLGLTFEHMETGINFTEIVESLLGSLSLSGSDNVNWGPVPAWWTGEASSIPFLKPFIAQSEQGEEEESGDLLSALDMFMAIDTERIQIPILQETGWPDKNSGEVYIKVGLPIWNKLMTIKIPELSIKLYKDEVHSELLASVNIDPATTILPSNQEVMLFLEIHLKKSTALESWLNDLLATFEITGFVDANVSLGVFGCTIPLQIKNLSLAALGLDASLITGLLDATNPFDPDLGQPLKMLTYKPTPAQIDMEALIGKFGLAWVEINPARWDVGPWDRNEQFPMINVSLGLALQPAFNLTLDSANHDPTKSDLQLCDRTIFDAILKNAQGEIEDDLWNTAVKYSKFADLYIRNTPVRFNNTYDGDAGQGGNYKINPHKPYFLNNTGATRAAVCQPSFDESKALGTYTFDDGTPSASRILAGARMDYSRAVRLEAPGSKAVSGTGGIQILTKETSPGFTNLTGFWEVSFWARAAYGPVPAYFRFRNESNAVRDTYTFTLDTTWRLYTFTVNNFTWGSTDNPDWFFNKTTRMSLMPLYTTTIYLDDLNITAPQTPSYTSWGDAGGLDLDPEVTKDSTFNFVEFNLLMYNISHPTFEFAYPRDLWRKMGGPYFPPIRYGKDYGGFPDHRYEYHEYFSPYTNFIGGALGMLSGLVGGAELDPSALIAGLALNGSLKVNIFSMDLTINVGTPALADLLGSLATVLVTALYKTVDRATNPMAKQNPFPAQFDDLFGALGDFPIVGLFYEIPIFLCTERNNHAFCPQYASQTGTNINPYDWFWLDPYGYKPGLRTTTGSNPNPNGANRENFHKDAYYNNFKVFVDNWAQSVGVENPFWETTHPLTGETYKDGVFDLRDPASWALRYRGNRYGGTGRTRSIVLNLEVSASLPITVGIEGVLLYFLMESQYVPCSYMPTGYIWLNQSLLLPQGPGWKDGSLQDVPEYMTPWNTKTAYPLDPEMGRNPAFSMYPSSDLPNPVRYDSNGMQIGSARQDDPLGTWSNPAGVGNWLLTNIRLFEHPSTYDWFQFEIGHLFDPLLGMFTVGCANASLFGYEFYNIGGINLELGHTTAGEAFCQQYASGSGGGSAWQVPGANGTQIPLDERKVYWPPKLPGFTPTSYMSNIIAINTDDLLAPIMNDIFGWLLGSISIDTGDILGIILAGNIHVRINAAELNNPIPLPMWIKSIAIDASISIDGGETWIGVGVTKSNDIWVEFDHYPGQVTNPYYLQNNPMLQIGCYEPVFLPDIDLWVQLPMSIIDLIGDLLGGGISFELDFKINNAFLDIALPAEWDYIYRLDAMSLIGELGDIEDLLGGLGG